MFKVWGVPTLGAQGNYAGEHAAFEIAPTFGGLEGKEVKGVFGKAVFEAHSKIGEGGRTKGAELFVHATRASS